ncbi:MAG: hypothetical protein RR827_04080, partial [Oscillospiraceae bacterium]
VTSCHTINGARLLPYAILSSASLNPPPAALSSFPVLKEIVSIKFYRPHICGVCFFVQGGARLVLHHGMSYSHELSHHEWLVDLTTMVQLSIVAHQKTNAPSRQRKFYHCCDGAVIYYYNSATIAQLDTSIGQCAQL